MNKKIIIIGGWAESLVNFRGDLILKMVESGCDVVAMAAETDIATVSQIENLGIRFTAFPVQRNGLNPWRDFHTLWALIKVFKVVRPDMVLSYTIKPVIWGGLAARLVGNVRFYALITGLGFAFQGNGFVRGALTKMVAFLYRTALRHAGAVIFQNPDNRQEFVERGIVSEDRCHVVNGSGINTEHFTQQPLPGGPMVFLLVARLLREKGIREYLEAARIVKRIYPEVIFDLLGPEDPSPDGISLGEVKAWDDEGVICYLGSTNDVRPYMAQCSVCALPSYHEGMPRSVLEAMAMGRPILTTDVSGCRETVQMRDEGGSRKPEAEGQRSAIRVGDNGVLVAMQNVDALVEGMEYFIKKPGKIQRMGDASRRYAEERFDVRKVNRAIMEIMGI